MIELGLSGVDYICANTDSQALQRCLAPTKIQLGPHLTRGLGAGGDPKIGEASSEESYRELNAAISGADMVFLTAGMGGGTGTGAISIAARVARTLGAVTVAIVTTPFSFEMGRRQQNARTGLSNLRPYVDTLITVPNDRLLNIAPANLSLELAFRMADDVLRQGIQGITELITQPGMINVDFAHVRQLMQMGGGSLLSIGYGQGENKAMKAVERALNHPLLEYTSIENATGIIANFTGGPDLTFMEVAEALNFLQEKTNNQAEIIPGVINNDQMVDRVQVILVITGLGATPVDTISGRQPAAQTPAAPAPAAAPSYQREAPVKHEMPPVREPVYTREPNTYREPYSYRDSAPAASETSLPIHQHRLVEIPPMELTGSPSDLELPAFLRRRVR
jgi:cell division protein FtsZ